MPFILLNFGFIRPVFAQSGMENKCLPDSVFQWIFSAPEKVAPQIDLLKKELLYKPNLIKCGGYQTIGIYYGVINKLDSARFYFFKALSFSPANSKDRARIYKNLALLYTRSGETAIAFRHLDSALHIAEQINDPKMIAMVYTEMATTYNSSNNLDQAIRYLNKSIQLLTALNIPNDHTLLVNKLNLANTYVQTEQYHFAFRLFISILPELKKQGDMANYFVALLNYSICLEGLKNYKQAEFGYNEVLKGAKKFNDLDLMLTAQQNLANMYLSTKQKDKATRIFKELFYSSIKSGNNQAISFASNYYALLNERGKYNQVIALDSLVRPYRIKSTIKGLKYYYQELGLSYFNAGQIDKGRSYLDSSEFYADSLNKMERTAFVKETQLEYQSKIQQNEIALLEQQSQLLKVENERKYLLLLGIIFITSSIFLFFIYKFRIRKKNLQIVNMHLQHEQMEKAKISLEYEKQLLYNNLQNMAISKHQLANESKTNFVRNVSHELLTPLHVISGISELLFRDLNASLSQLEQYAELKNASKKLIGLVDSIIEYEEIESGKIEIRNEAFDMHQFLMELKRKFEMNATVKGLTFQMETDFTKSEMYLSDTSKLHRIFENLMSNAIRFTQHGNISMRIKRLDSDVHFDVCYFEISDTGIGISSDKYSSIFNAFEQADNSNTRQLEGLGLGLTISNKIIEAMGGELKLQSVSGKGSTFYFELMFEKVESVQHPENAEEPIGFPTILQGKRFLIVEDHIMNAMVIKKFVTSIGSTFDYAANGIQALEKIKQSQFDVVLMDLQMPLMDGITCTQEIRKLQEPYYKYLPIVALTASKDQNMRELAIQSGVNELVTKPFDFNRLSKILVQVMHLES